MNAAEGLGDGDHPFRVVLLGRLSVAELGRGDLWASARQHAIDAIAMARRIGDPELIATALTDRHLTAMDRDDVEARADAADELIQLGEMARRPDRVLVGLQWRYGAALAPGDLEAAKGVLDHTEVLAALMPSPEWTYGVLLRRALLTAIDGDREAALALIQEARPLGDRVLWPDESLGLEVGARTLVTRITGVFDPDLPALNAEFESLAQLPPNAFFGAHSAAAALACGDVDDARRMVDRLAARVCRAEPTGEAPSTILLIAALAGELGLTQHASALRRLCEPFRGYLTTESGFAVDQPADATLADLALLDGDAVGALGMIDACLELVRSMPSSTYEARCLWRRSNINRALGNVEAADRDLQQAGRVGTPNRRRAPE